MDNPLAQEDVCLTRHDLQDPSGIARAFFGITATVSISLFIFYCFKLSQGRCTYYAIYVQSVTAGLYTVAAAGYADFVNAEININGELVTVPLGRYMFWMISCPCVLFSFLALYSLVGPPIKPSKVNFMVMKDLITLAFGVIATYQTNVYVKGLFITIAFIIGFMFLVDLYSLESRRLSYLEGETVFWVQTTTYFFLVTWGIFPMLYLLGPNVLDVTSADIDYIGHAIGDLLAKNVFGFLCWHVRYKIMLPYRERKGMDAISLYNPGFSKFPKPIIPGMGKEVAARVPGTPHGVTPMPENPPRVLVVEEDVGYQRLVMFLLERAGIVCDTVFDLDQAEGMLRRGSNDQYGAVLVNLSSHWDDPDDIRNFQMDIAGAPYHVPIVGYSFKEADKTKIIEEDTGPSLCSGVVLYALDSKNLEETVKFWIRVAEERRSLAVQPLERTMRRHGSQGSIQDNGMRRHGSHGSMQDQPSFQQPHIARLSFDYNQANDPHGQHLVGGTPNGMHRNFSQQHTGYRRATSDQGNKSGNNDGYDT